MALPVIDTALTFQGYISVKIVAGSKLRTKPYQVQGMDYISHGFAVYNTSSVSSANRARTQFYTSDGLYLSTVNHSFAVTQMWTDIKIEGVAVPSTAATAVLELYSTSGQYWATKIKSEEGQIATPYANNVSSYLTWITPRGIYTGNITANQITVAGTEKLADRLVTISDQFINLSNTDIGYGSRLTSIEAGQITLTNAQNSLSSTVGTHTSKITDIEAGKITLSDTTSGKIAGLTLSSSELLFSGTGAYFRLKASAGADYIVAGTSSASGDLKFRVTSNGDLYATNATIKGTLQAGSVINGSLSSTTGTHTGATTGTHSGSLSNATGSVSGITGSTGYISGTQFSGATAGYHTGTQSGAVYSSSGTLGSTNFTSYSGSLNFSTRVRSSSIVATSIYESNTIYGDLTLYGGFTNNSDIHFKQNVTPINKEPIIEGIYNLDLVNFEYKDREGSRIGIIANDVVSNLPNEFTKYTIFPNEDGYLTASYLNMSIMGIAAIQDLNERLKAVEEKLA